MGGSASTGSLDYGRSRALRSAISSVSDDLDAIKLVVPSPRFGQFHSAWIAHIQGYVDAATAAERISPGTSFAYRKYADQIRALSRSRAALTEIFDSTYCY
jgi:hypothetical protein